LVTGGHFARVVDLIALQLPMYLLGFPNNDNTDEFVLSATKAELPGAVLATPTNLASLVQEMVQELASYHTARLIVEVTPRGEIAYNALKNA